MPGITEYLVLGAILFALGLVGFLTRRNLIVMFLSTEVMFQGVVITAVAFARFHQHVQGQEGEEPLVAALGVVAGAHVVARIDDHQQ